MAVVQQVLGWQAQARCLEVDPEIFFPERGGSSRAARAVCSQCEVRRDCLLYALRNREQFGIWGGTSERERRKLRRLAS
jgi:WhiB family transcriptional regulator, redox-sensing transcriptional regulator